MLQSSFLAQAHASISTRSTGQDPTTCEAWSGGDARGLARGKVRGGGKKGEREWEWRSGVPMEPTKFRKKLTPMGVRVHLPNQIHELLYQGHRLKVKVTKWVVHAAIGLLLQLFNG